MEQDGLVSIISIMGIALLSQEANHPSAFNHSFNAVSSEFSYPPLLFPLSSEISRLLLHFFLSYLFIFFLVAPTAYGSSLARDPIQNTDVTCTTSVARLDP